MNRRDLLKGMGIVSLGSCFPAVLETFVSSCSQPGKKLRGGFFSDEEFHLAELVADTLLPGTTTPGALETQVPYFIDLVVKNCLDDKNQRMIKDGLKRLNDQSSGNFAKQSTEERLKQIKITDEAAFKNDNDAIWFRMFKKLALIGHFTSKEGMNKALNYVKVPGDYEACIPYKKGDKALAKTFLLYW